MSVGHGYRSKSQILSFKICRTLGYGSLKLDTGVGNRHESFSQIKLYID